jgi:hypothetical protein
MATKEQNKPGEPLRFTKTKDKYGAIWTTYPSKYSNKGSPLEIWADRSHKDAESFWLRQENDTKVDLIKLDLGQAYDVIRALTEALGTND